MDELNRKLEITKGTRIINCVVDLIFIAMVSSAITYALNIYYNTVLVQYAVYLVYYFSFETYNGQTMGKRITNTTVVNMYNEKPSIGRILLRTVLRLYPFDVVSYLFGQEQGAHDLISKTRLRNK